MRDYENDTLSQRDISSLTRGELEALVTWLRTEKAQRKADLKLALEANLVLCETIKQQPDLKEAAKVASGAVGLAIVTVDISHGAASEGFKVGDNNYYKQIAMRKYTNLVSIELYGLRGDNDVLLDCRMGFLTSGEEVEVETIKNYDIFQEFLDAECKVN